MDGQIRVTVTFLKVNDAILSDLSGQEELYQMTTIDQTKQIFVGVKFVAVTKNKFDNPEIQKKSGNLKTIVGYTKIPTLFRPDNWVVLLEPFVSSELLKL